MPARSRRTDLAELCEVPCLLVVCCRSYGPPDGVAFLEQLLNQFSPNETTCTRNYCCVRRAVRRWGHRLSYDAQDPQPRCVCKTECVAGAVLLAQAYAHVPA